MVEEKFITHPFYMYIGYFLLAFILVFLLTPAVRAIMRRFQIVDLPRSAERKIHKKKIPLGGGWAVFIVFFLVAGLVYFFTDSFGDNVKPRYLLALLIGSSFLMLGGFLDDKYNLRARWQLLFAVLAALTVIFFNIGPETVTNPFGGIISLESLKISAFVVFFWLMSVMFTTKLLDGLDGLVTGVVVIGAGLIAALSLQAKWYQPDLALLAVIFAGACVGFLLWNFYPAKIFLGQGGSLFLGFVLGCLAIISGGKIATTLLVVGVPMLDVARVIISRWRKGHPLFAGDSEHLHFRLLQSGLSQRQAVLLLYSVSFLFGVTTLFLQSRQKLIALAFLFILMLLIGVWLAKKE